MNEGKGNGSAVLQWTIAGLLAFVVFRVMRELFGKTEPLAKEFRRAAILADPAMYTAMNNLPDLGAHNESDNGHVPWSHLIWVQDNIHIIDEAAHRFIDAKGILNDQEARAVGAISMLPNPYAVAAFTSYMADQWSYTPVGYGDTFLEDADKAMIVEHLQRIGAYPFPYGLDGRL